MKLKTFRFRFSLLALFIVLFSFGSILAEPDFYDLQIPEYNSEHHVPMYRDRYYLNSFEQWNSSVVGYMNQMKTSWEAKADETIWSILNSIQSSDYFIDKEGYIDETFRSLETQKIRMMAEWELNANIDYYENQNIFIEKLNTGRLDQLFLDRIYDTQYFKSLSEHERGMYLEQQRFVDSVKHWENELNLAETKGLNDFSKAFTDLQSEYESYLNQIESTDAQFRENLGAINEYKNQVKQGIHSLIGYFRQNLAEECTYASGCQYRAGNQNLNEAGILMSSFIERISEQLTDSSIHPNFLLTEITKEIGAFLSEQQIKANQESVFYFDQIYTYQNGLNVNLSNSVSKIDVEQATREILHGNIDSVSSDQIYGNWEGSKEDAHLFNHVHDEYLRTVFRAIYHGDDSLLKSEIQSRLGNNRQVKEILYSNLYTHHQDYLNNLKILGFAVPFFHSSHDYGNLKLDGKENYGHWTAVRNLTEYTHHNGYYLMGKVGYGVLYKMYDKNSDDTFQYWDSNQTDLLGQFRMFEDNLRPSVFNWESKVVSYSNQYEDWKSESERLKEKAHEEFITKWTDLESKKEEWLHNLAEEKKRGKEEWIGLYTAGQLSETVQLSEKRNPISLESSFKNLNLEPLKFFEEMSQSGPDSQELEFGVNSFFNQLRMSFIGFDQYGSVLQSNQDISDFQKKEQQKLINQVTYAIHWKNRAISSYDEEGKIVGENTNYNELLKKFSESSAKQDCEVGDTSPNCFEVQFKDQLETLRKQNLDYVNGMIVNRLSETDKQNINSCYENLNGSNCSTYLIKEFDSKLDSNSNILTISKKINDGTIQGKNEKGSYKNGVIDEVRYVHLSTNTPVLAPNKKSFFEEWTNEDWKTLNDGKNLAFEKAIKSLDTDLGLLSSQTNDIRKEESRNEAVFQRKKQTQEKADSIVHDLVLAYFTGGTAGVKESIKNQFDSSINAELASAWIRGTGGSERDIQLATQAIQFMRGRKEMRDLKKQKTYIGFEGALDLKKYANLYVQAGNSVLSHIGTGVTKGLDLLNNWSGGVAGAVIGGFGSIVTSVSNVIAGKDTTDVILARKNARQNKMAELREKEISLAKSAASQAIAGATGLPIELVSAGVGDYVGSQKAKKARRAMSNNVLVDATTKLYGVVGGMVKTVAVASGIKESEIQHSYKQGNQLVYGNSFSEQSSNLLSIGILDQLSGMQASGTGFSGQLLNIKKKEKTIEELTKRITAEHVVKSSGISYEMAKAFIDKGYAEDQRRKSERSSQKAAIEQVAVTSATIAITMGASAALASANAAAGTVAGGASATTGSAAATSTTIATTGTTAATTTSSFFSSVGSVLQSVGTSVNTFLGISNLGNAAIYTGQAIANATVQGIYGSRHGEEGALAGIANGILGGATQIMGPIQSGVFAGITPGLGVTYNRDDKWGVMFGLGNAVQNASVSFSQRGDTTVSVSQSLGHGVQFSADVTTNGQQNFGFNYNPTGEGPRSDWNLSLMYDVAGSGLSASLGYTDPQSDLGLTSTLNGEGLSTSLEHLGVSIATNGPNGFQMDEINFAEQNINAAQDRTQSDQNNARLIASGKYTADDVARMKDEDKQKALAGLDEKAPKPDPNSFAGYLASIGSFVGGGMGTVLDLALGVGGVAVGAAGILAGLAGMPNIPVPNNNNPLAHLLRRPEEDYDSYIDRLTDALGGAWDGTVDGLLSGLRGIENGLGWAGDQIGNAYNAVTDAVGNLFGGGEGETVGAVGVGGISGTDSQERGTGQTHGATEGSASGEGGGGENGKPKPYPLDDGMDGKPVTFEKEVYSLSDSAKKEIADIKTRLSEIKVSDNEPEIVAAKKAIEAEQAKFSQTKSDLQKEIQSLREQIEDERRQLHSLENGNGLSTSAENPLALKIKIDSDFAKIKTLESKIKTVDTQLNDFMKKVAPTIAENAQNLALVRLQDSVLENPFRQDLRWNELALMGMEKGTFEYKETEERINILKGNVSEFEKAKDLLLNSSGDMQAKAAEYMLSVNPNLTIPSPTHKTETLTLTNSQAQPGFFSSPKFEGVLPGANVPGAIVSANEEDHKARHGISDYYAVDIALPHGTPYNAVAPGIAEVSYDHQKRGNYVKITHEHGLATIYMHNSDFLIGNGTPVNPTTPIARVGNTGNTRSDYPKGPPVNGGSHIHFEIHLDGKRVPINSFDWDRYKNEGNTYLNEVRKRLEK